MSTERCVIAISSSVVWEVRAGATAANANGGGFKPGASGVDYSQQGTAQYNLTLVTTAAANATLLSASAATDMVGNIAHIISGTNFTTGWYEIISVVAGVSITLDRTCTTAAGASGVVNIGGAISLNSSTANQTDTLFASSLVAGNTVWIKGALTLAATFTATAGASGTPINMFGYNATRGDNPTGSNRPSINCAAFVYTGGASNLISNVIFSGTASNILTVSGSSLTRNCKITNTSTTAGRTALNVASSNTTIWDCEAISYRGQACSVGNSAQIDGCYFHDSDIGVLLTGSTGVYLINSIISSNVTQAISNTGAGITGNSLFLSNTFYGAENKLGQGINIVSGTTMFKLLNNIFYGFTTGILDNNGVGVNYGDYNDLNNNTTNYNGLTAGAHDITTSPAFVGVAQISGTNGTTSGSVLSSSGASFGTVTDNVDFCYLVSGTGITAGKYLITSHTTTTLTLDSAPGTDATADKVFQVTTGHNFATGTGLNGLAFPGAFQAGLSTSSSKQGAVQSAGGASAASVGYSF